MPKVIFLELYKQKDPALFWENELFFALLDRYPVSPGHALLVPKREVLNLADLNLHEKAGFLSSILEAHIHIPWNRLREFYAGLNSPHAQQMLEHPSLGELAEDFNIGVNDGPNAGRTVAQLHVHLIPRYPADVADPKGGLRLLMGEELGRY